MILSAVCGLTSLWLFLAQLSFKFLILCFQCLYLLQDTTVFIVLCPVDKTCALTTFRVASVSPMPEHDTIIPRVILVWLLYWDFNVMRQKSKKAAVAWNLKPGHLIIWYIHPSEATMEKSLWLIPKQTAGSRYWVAAELSHSVCSTRGELLRASGCLVVIAEW